jgi:hypothetical protein
MDAVDAVGWVALGVRSSVHGQIRRRSKAGGGLIKCVVAELHYILLEGGERRGSLAVGTDCGIKLRRGPCGQTEPGRP